MGPRKSRNPLAFTAYPVTFITTLTYIAVAVGLLYIHLIVPSPPDDPTAIKGINITEAWQDLQTLSGSFHPYNSRQNDQVRSWLLNRIYSILEQNDAEYGVHDARATKKLRKEPDVKSVIVFDDLISNFTVSSSGSPLSVYFEGTNIIVYVRGSEDGENDWWLDPASSSQDNKHGVLVNAHYDSVSTSFGATDDGVGVVSILQLIKYFTTAGNKPSRGLVALFNNGEEDYLNGARAFMRHPISRFCDTFLNLEGAGAGGRAILFRSTDTEVTQAYKKSPYPFGTVLASDSFGRKVVRSQTDYVIFNGELGLRGLDIAFFEPRARYHTSEDSARWTSKASVFHMLSAALATTKGLTADTDTNFESGKGTTGVWFDLLGSIFALTRLHTMFAISVTLLVVAPIIMIALAVILSKLDRYYLFARSAKSDPLDPRSPDDETIIQLNGWRGLFRYPLAFVLATSAVAGLAFLVTKINPNIIYSSPYAVWSMMLSAWFIVAWFFLRGADYMRPTALHRAHAYGWLFFLFWVVLALDTVAENNFRIASGYILVIYFAAIFLALLISYLEFFALPRKAEYVQAVGRFGTRSRALSPNHRPSSTRSGLGERSDNSGAGRDTDDPSETTSLLSKKHARYGRRDADEEESEDDEDMPLPNGRPPFGDEQTWSGTLPSWLWVLQFLIVGPILIIVIGQLGLFIVSALGETLADGNGALFIYATTALVSVMLLVPVSPFLHRFSSRVPTFLFFIFLGTLLYNLLAFPFSAQNRLKVFFVQDLDLATGGNKVSLTGLDGYLQQIIETLPSAAGQQADCTNSPFANKNGLVTCSWTGLAPNVVPTAATSGQQSRYPLQSQFKSWVSINATRLNTTHNEAILQLSGQNTKACRLFFDSPISSFSVSDAASDDRLAHSASGNETKEIRLWRRDWSKAWTVKVEWKDDAGDGKAVPLMRRGLKGNATCLWSDANEAGTIPALAEIKAYLPVWAAVTKVDDGLVQGHKSFKF